MTTNQKLTGNRFAQADFSIARCAALVPAETTLEDVTHPEYFNNYLHSLRRGMTIEVLSDDDKLDCTLRVLRVTKTSADVRVIRLFDEAEAPKVQKAELSPVEVNHGGPIHKWRFIHNGEVIEKGFETRADAERAAGKYTELLKGE